MHSGYSKQLFLDPVQEFLECHICLEIAKLPLECSGCGTIYCKDCVDDWMQKNKNCPNRCQGSKFNELSMILRKKVNKIRMKCLNQYCAIKQIPYLQYQTHVKQCKAGCKFFKECGGYQDSALENFCSIQCLITEKLVKARKQFKNVYQQAKLLSALLKPSQRWSQVLKSPQIKVSENQKDVLLNQTMFLFRSVLGQTPFHSGIHYWELTADPITTNQAKIGVSLSDKFNFDTAFCDHQFGYALYGSKCQLRHKSNVKGVPYAPLQRFKNKGVVGILLNMNEGTISFIINGKNYGVGFKDDRLKKGPIWPAVALLHCSGVKAQFGLPIPK